MFQVKAPSSEVGWREKEGEEECGVSDNISDRVRSNIESSN